MPNYNDLRPEEDQKKKDYALVFPSGMTKTEKKRTIQNLLKLREGLRSEDGGVATKKAGKNLLIASWNIKEFGHTTQRLPEAYFYIAETLNAFDLVIVQEVKSGLEDLQILMQLLGDDWAYLINDITEGDSGNSERGAFLFNTKRVEFGGLAGEIVLWDDLTQNSPIKQLKRTPYITGFTAGWKTFSIINVHVQPNDSVEAVEYRREEVRLLLEAIERKISAGRLWNENLILAGDFNFYEDRRSRVLDGPTIEMINLAGYREIEGLSGKDTNASGSEIYDRLFLTSNEFFTVGRSKNGVERGDVFNVFEHVYRDGQEDIYKTDMKKHYGGSANLDDPAKLRKYYQHPWRKNQMSDHLPIWFELIVDSSDEFLEEKLESY